MKTPVYLGQASKIVIYKFHYDYMVLRYGDLRLKLCYIDTDSLIYHIKTKDFYSDPADNVPTKFDTSGYNPDCPLPIGLKKKVIELIKDELGGKIMTKFVALRPKLYSYRELDGAEGKKCKGIEKFFFEDYKDCLLHPRDVYRSQLMFRSMINDISLCPGVRF